MINFEPMTAKDKAIKIIDENITSLIENKKNRNLSERKVFTT